MNKIIGFIISTLLVTILIASCGTRKSGLVETNYSKGVGANIVEKRFDFNTFSAKLGISYRDKSNKTNVNATIRIKHDSIIWLSIAAPILGFEAVRVVLTKDSAKMINKISKEYVVGSYSYISKMVSIDANYEILENILLGNSIRSTKGVFVQDMRIDNNNNRMAKMIIRLESDIKVKLIADYYDFKMVEKEAFPMKMQFAVPERSVKIELEYSKIVLNKDNQYPFTIPTSYQRIIHNS